MSLHKSTFQYAKPTEDQLRRMEMVRDAALTYSIVLDQLVPEGPDKTYLMRQLREVNSWAMVAITRLPDGSPRTD